MRPNDDLQTMIDTACLTVVTLRKMCRWPLENCTGAAPLVSKGSPSLMLAATMNAFFAVTSGLSSSDGIVPSLVGDGDSPASMPPRSSRRSLSFEISGSMVISFPASSSTTWTAA